MLGWWKEERGQKERRTERGGGVDRERIKEGGGSKGGRISCVKSVLVPREQWPQPEEDGEIPPQLPGGGGSGLLQPCARRPAPPPTVQGGDTGRGQGSAQEVRFETLSVFHYQSTLTRGPPELGQVGNFLVQIISTCLRYT